MANIYCKKNLLMVVHYFTYPELSLQQQMLSFSSCDAVPDKAISWSLNWLHRSTELANVLTGHQPT
jgi:hypothetical protein